MSCESRHRAIITDLLTLAGLRDTVPADEVMGVGVANRRRRGRLPTTAAAQVSLHADAQRALDITGHSDQATPAWVSSLVTLLDGAADRGNRRALLTMRWLTGGWEDVTPIITEYDRAWIMIATRCGIRVPPAWEARVMATRPSVADVGRRLTTPVRDTIVMMEILDALRGIDDVSPDAVQTVTPPQVLRFLLGRSSSTRTDRQRVLRAVLDGAPVVRETVAWLDTVGWDRANNLPVALIGRAARARRRASVEQIGGDAVLTLLAGWIRQADGSPVSHADLRNPSPAVVEAIFQFLRRRRIKDYHLVGAKLAALLHIWRINGRDDAVADVIRRLGQIRSTQWYSFLVTCSTTTAAIVTGAIHPPHGDALLAGYLAVPSASQSEWSVLTAGAIYAAACQSVGYVPTVVGIEDLVHNRWAHIYGIDRPSPIPLLTVGREQKLLVPALHAARDPDQQCQMLLDVIDALDMLDMAGGTTQALQDVLADVLTDDSSAIDPLIMIRLAASPCGQAVLSHLPTVAPPPPIGTKKGGTEIITRLISHLASPWWGTAPPHLCEWWETAMKRAAFGTALVYPPPLYPTVLPQAAVMCPHPNLIARAVAHRQWATIPDADRRACLDTALPTMRPDDLLRVAGYAATATALHDIAAAVARADSLSDTDKGYMRQLIDPDAWGGQHEL